LRKVLLAISVTLIGLVGTASAASLCTPTVTTLTTTQATYTGGLLFPGTSSGGGGPIVCGAVTFSNFQVFDAAPSTSTGSPFVLLSGTYDGATTTLSFNPNLNNASVNQDIHVLFSVSSTSPIIGAGLMNGGSTNSGINERFCSGSVDPFSGVCSGGTQLGALSAPGGVSASSTVAPAATSFTVYKDVGHPATGELTGFTQTFTTQGVPEPATFAMLGGGLVLFALARRKKRM
jgi:hypothetical protein